MSGGVNLKVFSDWKRSVSDAFRILRRTLFVYESDFTFQTFDPQINWNGMVATAISTNRARFLRISKTLLFSIDIRATLAAPFATSLSVAIPQGGTSAGTQVQGGGAYMFNAGVAEVGTWSTLENGGVIMAQRPGNAAYTAGSFIFIANGFIELV